MDLGIAGKVALVTGAGKNIGRAIAIELAREGAQVIIVGRTQTHLDEVLSAMVDRQGQHIGIALDLTLAGSLQCLQNSIPSGFDSIDIVVHNLGGSLGVTDPFSTSGEWAKVWQFNLGIALDINRLLAPSMIHREWGRILHLSTLSTRTFDGYPSYISAKCALDGYVQSMARHLSRHNVIMNALAPGLINIEGRYFSRLQKDNPALMEDYFDRHLPMRRMGSAEEIAAVAAFLCSDQAAFMPGSIVRADGGGN